MYVSVYGNAPPGEHSAVFAGISEQHFHKAKTPNRLIVAFTILDDDGMTPKYAEDGTAYHAVAVCNIAKEHNPKSKAFKIRKAMLQVDEWDPVVSAARVPDWEHFREPTASGERRVLRIRVEQRAKHGPSVSVVTHIKRPRDDVWENIEGVYEGAARQDSSANTESHSKADMFEDPNSFWPKWLSKNGKLLYSPWTESSDLKNMNIIELTALRLYNEHGNDNDPWNDMYGNFVEYLKPDEFANLDHDLQRARYIADRLKYENSVKV